MKKTLLTGALLLGSLFAMNAQTVIFEENWDGTGPGVAGWTLYNVDENTPYADDPISVQITNAWNILSLADFQTALELPEYAYPEDATGMAGNVAISGSWYTPAGVSNDWLVSPSIVIPTGTASINLTFAANSLGADAFLEDYEVNISTTTNEVASFSLLLDVPNELNTGNYRTISLDAYKGQTVYIAFRNIGDDQYVMQLDNIKVTSSETTGVNDVLASKLSVFPNPANDIVTISNGENILINSVEVVDLNGRIVKSSKYDGATEVKINISNLSNGMYMMNVSSDKGTTTKKIVKN